jgi:hypothetical protein
MASGAYARTGIGYGVMMRRKSAELATAIQRAE